MEDDRARLLRSPAKEQAMQQEFAVSSEAVETETRAAAMQDLQVLGWAGLGWAGLVWARAGVAVMCAASCSGRHGGPARSDAGVGSSGAVPGGDRRYVSASQ